MGFQNKKNVDGSTDRCKTWLVAKDFHQLPGVDLDKTFGLVVEHTTIRIVLSLASRYNYRPLHQLDVCNAFLHGFHDENVYMLQPQGYHDHQNPTYLCKLNLALYGLK